MTLHFSSFVSVEACLIDNNLILWLHPRAQHYAALNQIMPVSVCMFVAIVDY